MSHRVAVIIRGSDVADLLSIQFFSIILNDDDVLFSVEFFFGISHWMKINYYISEFSFIVVSLFWFTNDRCRCRHDKHSADRWTRIRLHHLWPEKIFSRCIGCVSNSSINQLSRFPCFPRFERLTDTFSPPSYWDTARSEHVSRFIFLLNCCSWVIISCITRCVWQSPNARACRRATNRKRTRITISVEQIT